MLPGCVLCRECGGIRPETARRSPPVHHGLSAPGASPLAGDQNGSTTISTTINRTGAALDRRALLRRVAAGAAGATIGATAALPAAKAAIAIERDPIPALVDEYFRLIDVVNEPDCEQNVADLAFAQEEAIAQRIVDTTATTGAGIMAQLRLLRDIIETSGDQWTDNRNVRLLDTLASGVERLASGGAA